MLYILNKAIKYYTGIGLKISIIILIPIIIIFCMIGVKYTPLYKVSINGTQLGYINNKDEIDSNISELMNASEKNIAFVINENLPKFELVFSVDSNKNDNEEIMETITNTPLVAYKTYAIVLDEQEKEVVNSFDEATEIVNDIKNEIGEEYQLTLGIREVYTYNTELEMLPELSLAKAEIEDDINKKIEILGSTVNGVYLTKPIEGTITSRYGVISSIRSSAHTGLDIANSTGTKIYASASGIVKKARYSGGYGNLIILEHENGVETYYAHCSQFFVNEGEEVEQGQVIASVGSTGNSTGPHLHFEVRVDGATLNPQNFLYK